MGEDWDWELTDTANREFDGLDEYAQERITSKRNTATVEVRVVEDEVTVATATEVVHVENASRRYDC